MGTESGLERELNNIVGRSNMHWQPVFQLHGREAPWHQVLAQLEAVLTSVDQILYVDSEIPDTRVLESLTLNMVVFTPELLLHSTLAADQTPRLSIIPRSRIREVRLLEVPASVKPNKHRSDYYRIELEYPSLNICLPFDSDSAAASAAIHDLLPSLIADLKNSSKAR